MDRAASPRDIKRAWRLKSLRMHPDKGGDGDAWLRLQSSFEALKGEGGRAATRVGAGADWALAVRLMKRAASVVLTLHYPPSVAVGASSAVDFDDHATASPAKPPDEPPRRKERSKGPPAARAPDDGGRRPRCAAEIDDPSPSNAAAPRGGARAVPPAPYFCFSQARPPRARFEGRTGEGERRILS